MDMIPGEVTGLIEGAGEIAGEGGEFIKGVVEDGGDLIQEAVGEDGAELLEKIQEKAEEALENMAEEDKDGGPNQRRSNAPRRKKKLPNEVPPPKQ